MSSMIIPPAVLRALLRYDRVSGRLYWLPRSEDWFVATSRRGARHICASWNAKFAGKEAFTAAAAGYRIGCVLGVALRAHHVIWCMETGSWPLHEIDHINGIRDDNRIENLRDVTRRENTMNRSLHSNNKSGFNGVYWNERDRRWRAGIIVNKRKIFLGSFRAKDDAIEARKAADFRYGFHANHGRASCF